jgi:hypothetical protein
MAHLSNTATHRANRLLAALEPEDFAYLEPHLRIPGMVIGGSTRS